MPVPNALHVDDDRGLCRSSANLKTVYEGTESLGEPQVLGSKPVQQALAALQRSLHISLQTASQAIGHLMLQKAAMPSFCGPPKRGYPLRKGVVGIIGVIVTISDAHNPQK